jgi:hypothetical protein
MRRAERARIPPAGAQKTILGAGGPPGARSAENMLDLLALDGHSFWFYSLFVATREAER